MDYGKLAYLKAEDLQRQLSDYGAKYSAGAARQTLVFDGGNESFIGSYQSAPMLLSFKGTGTLEAGISFNLSGGSAAADIELYIDGILAESKKLQISSSVQSYYVCFICENLPQGENELHFKLSTYDSAQRSLSNLTAVLAGSGISGLKGGTNISVLEEGSTLKVMFGDGRTVRLYEVFSDGMTENMWFAEHGDYFVCAFIYYSGGVKMYDILYFFIDQGKLYMTAIPVYSTFSKYTVPVEGDVTCGDAVSVLAGGAALCYAKGKTLYFLLASKDEVTGKIFLHGAGSSALPAGVPARVKAVKNMDKGFAFAATDKKSKNTVLMYDGRMLSCTRSVFDADTRLMIAGNG